ncbi:MAG: hypothetical protein KY469_01165 [Actinobacteria bacterium]|nr:hypothetical protein [Actinomycetota bacterium]
MPTTDRETIATYTTPEEAHATADELRAEGHDAGVQRVDDDGYEVTVPRSEAIGAERLATERTQRSVQTHA